MRIRHNSWATFLKRAGRGSSPPASLLCLDPGETTGWAIFRNGNLTGSGQFRVTNTLVFDKIIDRLEPTHLVVENYRIYPWKSKQHNWSDVPTLRYIGAIQHAAALRGVPITMQMAQLVKTFCTNTKLKSWGVYKEDKKHANDAIRHGCYFLLFVKRR
jgi:hypothetical protein